MLASRSLGILGFGKVGEALALGLRARAGLSPDRILASVRRESSVERARKRTDVKVTTDNAYVVDRSDILLVAVKPHMMSALLDEVGARIRTDQLVISVAASVTTAQIEARLPAPAPVIRVMPNTPCVVGEGMSVLAAGANAGPDHMDVARSIFGAVGRTAVLEERLFDAVTGLSGSGPAYIYVIIESLAEAGVKLGMPREAATELSAQAVLGAARMVLERGEHPALLKDEVTTPAGCTIDGLLALEEGRLRVTLVKAVVRAARRAGRLANGI